VKKLVSVQEFSRACMEGWRPQLVDVRSETEFAAGHIPGAINIPLTEMDFRCGDLNPGLPLVIVSGNSSRAELAAKMLASRHACITILAGGTASWVSSGYTLVSTTRTRWSVERQARLVVGAILLTSLGLSHFVHPYWLFVAGTIGIGLVTAGLTDVCFMGTLMGRMPWNGAPCPPISNNLNREQTEIPAT
jgi:rhodanese-related sulfurtransferase